MGDGTHLHHQKSTSISTSKLLNHPLIEWISSSRSAMRQQGIWPKKFLHPFLALFLWPFDPIPICGRIRLLPTSNSPHPQKSFFAFSPFSLALSSTFSLHFLQFPLGGHSHKMKSPPSHWAVRGCWLVRIEKPLPFPSPSLPSPSLPIPIPPNNPWPLADPAGGHFVCVRVSVVACEKIAFAPLQQMGCPSFRLGNGQIVNDALPPSPAAKWSLLLWEGEATRHSSKALVVHFRWGPLASPFFDEANWWRPLGIPLGSLTDACWVSKGKMGEAKKLGGISKNCANLLPVMPTIF